MSVPSDGALTAAGLDPCADAAIPEERFGAAVPQDEGAVDGFGEIGDHECGAACFR